ncbi:hypothetical protein RIF29_46076 [Crotalaria pallida]|uniref:Triacylglycerol lipase n=1 Tax=Crotalaria pallida TaxID=3830 RepID=A0AAN9DSU9_CROPI
MVSKIFENNARKTYEGQDMLADVNDVQVLLNDLKDHDEDKLVQVFREDYAHVDFVMGVSANKFVFDPIMAFFEVN